MLARNYIEEKTRNVEAASELIIFTGDLNVNGHSENSIVAEYR